MGGQGERVEVSLYRGELNGRWMEWEKLFSVSEGCGDLVRREYEADELRREGIWKIGLSNEGDDDWTRVRVDVTAEPGFRITTTGLDPVESLEDRGDSGEKARKIGFSVMLPRKSFGENWIAADAFFNGNTRVSVVLIR